MIEILIVVIGFSTVHYWYLRHIARLEILLKSDNPQDFKSYSITNKPAARAEEETKDIPTQSLQEEFADYSSEEIREAFQK